MPGEVWGNRQNSQLVKHKQVEAGEKFPASRDVRKVICPPCKEEGRYRQLINPSVQYIWLFNECIHICLSGGNATNAIRSMSLQIISFPGAGSLQQLEDNSFAEVFNIMLCGIGWWPEKLTWQGLMEPKLADNQAWPALLLAMLRKSVMPHSECVQILAVSVNRAHRLHLSLWYPKQWALNCTIPKLDLTLT